MRNLALTFQILLYIVGGVAGFCGLVTAYISKGYFWHGYIVLGFNHAVMAIVFGFLAFAVIVLASHIGATTKNKWRKL